MKLFAKISSIIFFISIFCVLLNCKEEKTEIAFRFLERNSYFIDSYNGISVYRDNETKKPMSGNIVVGDKLRKWGEFKLNDGKTIHQNIKNGKVFSEQISSNYDNFEAMKFYNDDGSLKVYLQMLSQDDKHYLIELNENGDEIKRIDIKANPQEFFKYRQYFVGM